MAKRRNSHHVWPTAHGACRILLLVVIAVCAGALFTPTSAHAAPHTSNYQLDVQVTNGPFSYGGNTLPQFQATLTALNGTLSTCTSPNYVTIAIDSDPGQTWGSSSNSAPGGTTCVYTSSGPGGWSGYTTGSRTATAQATVNGQVVATSTVTFTINPVVTSTNCFVNTPGPNFQAGSTLQIGQQVEGPSTNYTPDWTKSTFDVTFTGPQSVTYKNIAPDTSPGAGWLTVQAPATPGQYTMTCTFDGNGNYASSTSGPVPVVISAFNQIGGIQLYTNPTTYNPYQSCDVYIVFQAPPGGPTPTGRAFITIGQSSTAVMDIASDGTLSVRLDPQQQPETAGNQIKVSYMGDSYYRSASSTFSFTNPAIPGGAQTGGGSGSGSKAGTPGATATKTATGTPGAATPSAAGAKAANTGSSRSGSPGGSPLLWIVVVVLVLGLGGAGAALLLRARRAKSTVGVPVQAHHSTGWQPPLDW